MYYTSLFFRLFISFQLNFYAMQWPGYRQEDLRIVPFARQGKRFFFPPKHTDQLWDLSNFMSSGYRGPYLQG